MKNPYISVVIPAYNEEKYLPQCLESIMNQTYPKDRYEVIVSDNNSTDKTPNIAMQYGAKVLHVKKQGNTFALEKGWSNAKGVIIAGTDADSIPQPNWLEEIEKSFDNPEIIALTGKAHTDFRSPIMRYVTTILYDIFLRISFAFGIPNLSGFNIAFRNEAYQKVGGINTNLSMSTDVELGKRLKKIGTVIYNPSIEVTTSARRWNNGFFITLWEYIGGYILVNFLHKSPKKPQKILR